MENKEPRLVKVRIFGQEYSIRATTEEKYIKEVAAYVDKKMAEIQKSVPSGLNASKIAILAAMNIADDLFAEKRNREKSTNEVERKVSSLIEVVEEAIQQ